MLKLISILMFVFAICSVLVFSMVARPHKSDEWSNSSIIEAIIEKKPYMMVNRKAIIQVSNIKKIEPGWYIVTIESIHSTTSVSQVKVVLFDQGSRLELILGPEVDFPDYLTNSLNLPDSVILELRKA